jgi:hypothetical protein
VAKRAGMSAGRRKPFIKMWIFLRKNREILETTIHLYQRERERERERESKNRAKFGHFGKNS